MGRLSRLPPAPFPGSSAPVLPATVLPAVAVPATAAQAAAAQAAAAHAAAVTMDAEVLRLIAAELGGKGAEVEHMAPFCSVLDCLPEQALEMVEHSTFHNSAFPGSGQRN